MSYNNTYFLEANNHIQFERVLLKTIDHINTYTTNSFYLEEEILAATQKKLFVDAQEFFSNTNKLILSRGKNSSAEKFSISFNGEGILFKILFVKNEEWKNGYISLEFEPENHSLLKVLQQTILNLTDSTTQQKNVDSEKNQLENKLHCDEIEKRTEQKIEVVAPKSSGSCQCSVAPTSSSGGHPILISDFTTNYITHFRYSNWDEWGIFTCNDCQNIWFIRSSYTDRPPYVCSADTIEESKLKNLQRFSSDIITELLNLEGVYLLEKIVDGFEIDVEAIRIKHIPKCRCADFGDDLDGDNIRAITQVTDSNELTYRHEYKEEYVVIYSCKLCKTPWLFFFTDKSSGKKGWGVKKISEQKLHELLKEGKEKLNLLLETEGINHVLKRFA